MEREMSDWTAERFEQGNCPDCGYNGMQYFNPNVHPCAAKYHRLVKGNTEDGPMCDKCFDGNKSDDLSLHEQMLYVLESGRQKIVDLQSQLAEARHDIQAYRGALGYSVPADHDGKLADGTTPKCGLCDAAQQENERLTIKLASISDARKGDQS